MFAVTALLLPFMEDYWSLFATGVANGLSVGVFVMCTSLVPHEIVGTELFPTAMGVASTCIGLGNAIIAPIGGE